MIEIYLKNNTNYDKNGDITLNPTSCTYKESEKELTLEHGSISIMKMLLLQKRMERKNFIEYIM